MLILCDLVVVVLLSCLMCLQELHAHINGSISEETLSKLVCLKQSKDKSWQASSQQLKLGRHFSLTE